MADQDVRITEVSLDNDSMWATEKTLEALLESIVKLGELSSDQKKEIEDGFKDMAATGKVTRDNLKQQKAKGGGGDNIFGDATSGLMKFTASADDTATSMSDLESGPLAKFSKGLVGATKKMGLLGGLAAGLMSQVGAAIKTIQETVDAMRNLNSVGITIKGDFMAFQESLKVSGTTIAELTEISLEYSRTVGQYGVKAIVDMARGAEDANFQFKNYGLRLAEGTKFQAELLESQRRVGLFRQLDERAQSLALQDNIKRLSAYSKILNVSREDMIKERLEASSRADIQLMFNSMPEDAKEAAKKSYDQLTDMFSLLGPEAAGMGDMVKTILADPAAVASEEFKQLASTAPELAQQILDLRDSVMSGQEIGTDSLIGFGEVLNEAAKSGQLRMLALNDATKATAELLGGTFLTRINDFIARTGELRAGGLTEAEIIEEYAKKTNESVKKATEAQTELDLFAATVKEARVKVFDNLLGVEAAGILDAAIEGIRMATAGVDKLGGVDYRGAIEGVITALGDFGSDIGLWISDTWHGIKEGLSDLWGGIQAIIDKIIAFPAQMWNTIVEVLNKIPGITLDTIAIEQGASTPVTPASKGVERGTPNTAGRQAIANQAATAGATPAQIAIFERGTVAQEKTVKVLERLERKTQQSEG